MLRVDERKALIPPFSIVTREIERSDDALLPAPAVPLIARDSYVAETATKIEQLQASMRLLARDMSEIAGKLSRVQDAADQDHRWHAYQQSEKRTKETKLDEVLRACRDLKARLDRIDARGGGNYHAYNSFESVSRKLAELEGYRDEAQRIERRVTLRAWLFCGTVVAATGILAVSGMISG